MQSFAFRADGARGCDSIDGFNGGYPGGDGGDATRPTAGQPGGLSTVFLESGASGGPYSLTDVNINGSIFNHRNRLLGNRNATIHASSLAEVILSSIGGDGGHGGCGGRGGDGAQGRHGTNATQYSSGGMGQTGGRGGNGGYGTSGANGGSGGLVRANVYCGDEYLLMCVPGIDVPANLPEGIVHGGAGGRKGVHGRGGMGGPGGQGGSGYSWTESKQVSQIVYVNGQSQTQYNTVTTYHSQPGGMNGSSGPPGITPSTPLYNGNDGGCGRIELVVHGERRGLPNLTYFLRFNLSLQDFRLGEEAGPDVDGVFEFGELCHATELKLQNTGGMPTPEQRVRLILKKGIFVLPVDIDEVFLTGPLHINAQSVVDGRLRFHIAYPRTDHADDYAPLIVHEEVRPLAIQLGPEPPGVSARHTPFQRQYDRVTLTRTLMARFPASNARGILGLRSLSPGESSALLIDTFNCSTLPLGFSSGRRNVCMSICLSSASDVSTDAISFYGADGLQKDLGIVTGDINRTTTDDKQLPAYVVSVPLIQANSTTSLRFRLDLKSDILPFSGITLLAAFAIQDMAMPDKWRIVQRRRMDVRAELAFVPNPEARVVLVTNNSLTLRVFQAWETLLRDHLQIPFEIFSVTRYGHFDTTNAVLADGKLLSDHLQNKIVIVPNLQFNLGTPTNHILRVPTDLLPGTVVRTPIEAEGRPKFVVLGSRQRHEEPFGCGSIRHFIEPVVRPGLERLGGLDFERQRDFWSLFHRKKSALKTAEFPTITRPLVRDRHAASSDSVRNLFKEHLDASVDQAASQSDEIAFGVPQLLGGSSSDVLHAASDAVHANDPSLYYHEIMVHDWTVFSCCFNKSIFNGKALMKVANKFARKLAEKCPTMAFTVVSTDSENAGLAGCNSGLFPRWYVGKLQIRGRRDALNVPDSTAIHVFGEGAIGGTAQPMISSASLFGFALSMPIAERLHRVELLLRNRRVGSEEAVAAPITLALMQAMMNAVVADIAAEVEEVITVSAPTKSIPLRLTCLAVFTEAASFHTTSAIATPDEKLVILRSLAVLRALARALTVWYAWWGRRRTCARMLKKTVEAALVSWVSSGDREEISATRKAMEVAVQEVYLLMKARRKEVIPFASNKANCFGNRHTMRHAVFEYCRRPAGQEVAKDTEAARHHSRTALSAAQWRQRVDEEAARDLQARNYFLQALQERAELLQGLAAGQDNRLIEPPTYTTSSAGIEPLTTEMYRGRFEASFDSTLVTGSAPPYEARMSGVISVPIECEVVRDNDGEDADEGIDGGEKVPLLRKF